MFTSMTGATATQIAYKAWLDAPRDSNVVTRLDDISVSIVTSKSPADFVMFLKSETGRFGLTGFF